MSHFEIYKIKGRLYKYQVWNYRKEGKVRHKKKYAGPVEPVRERNHSRKPGGGRKPVLFVRNFETGEKEVIKHELSSQESFTKERARVILLSSEGKPVKEIARAISKEVRSVRAAIKDFNKRGLPALKRGKTTGRKPMFDAEKRAGILSLASSDPARVGEAFTTWSLPKLKRCLEKKGVRISIESIRRILRKQKFRLRKSRKFQYSNDPDFVKKNLK